MATNAKVRTQDHTGNGDKLGAATLHAETQVNVAKANLAKCLDKWGPKHAKTKAHKARVADALEILEHYRSQESN